MKNKHITSSSSVKEMIRYFFSGFAMGSADIVPGVSGGTIALIVGIYEKLLTSINLLSGQVLKLFFKGEIKKALNLIPFSFLIPLALGIFTAIFTLAKLLEWLLLNHPSLVWSFFFGLVLASILVVRKRVKVWEMQTLIAFIIGAISAYVIVGLTPVETPATLLAFFLSGAIAICAMILPGISGSFILVILGKYSQVLDAVTRFDLVTLTVFILGCIIGLSFFSRLLTYLFKHYHDLLVAALTGIMLGSLRKIWPYKKTLQTYIDSHGIEMPLVQENIIPEFSLYIIFGILLGILGMFLILYLSKFDKEE